MAVVSLAERRALPVDDVAASLRRLADEIESGETGFVPALGVVLLASMLPRHAEGDTIAHEFAFDMRTYGPRADPLSIAGALAFAAAETTSRD